MGEVLHGLLHPPIWGTDFSWLVVPLPPDRRQRNLWVDVDFVVALSTRQKKEKFCGCNNSLHKKQKEKKVFE